MPPSPAQLVLIDAAMLAGHCRADADDTSLAIYGAAAERAALDYLDCNVYPDAAGLAAAIAAAPQDLLIAATARTAALAAADAIEDHDTADAARTAANRAFSDAQDAARRVYQGFIVNDAVRAAVLLIAGHLYANRENVLTGPSAAAVQLPMDAQSFLWPHRRGLGI